MTWPWLAENLWQATADGGLAVWVYGACEVMARVAGGKQVCWREDTDYPFGGAVTLTVGRGSSAPFPLYLRIPRWCRRFSVRLNGQPVAAEAVPGQYLRVARVWQTGDVVSIEMGMEVGVTTWPRNGSVTVDRGPLSYSVRIGERWHRCGGTESWPEWEVFPTTPWNWGLVLDDRDPVAAWRVIEKGHVPAQPWTPTAAPIEITAPARQIPGWGLVNQTADQLPDGPVRSDQPTQPVTLVPLGCARLRIGCLPVISEAAHARPWP